MWQTFATVSWNAGPLPFDIAYGLILAARPLAQFGTTAQGTLGCDAGNTPRPHPSWSKREMLFTVAESALLAAIVNCSSMDTLRLAVATLLVHRVRRRAILKRPIFLLPPR